MTCTKKFSTQIYELAEIKAEKMTRRLGHPLYVYKCPEHDVYHLTSRRRGSGCRQRSGAWNKAKRKLRPQIDVWESEGGYIRS